MTTEEFEQIFEKDNNSKWEGDNVLKGLLILAKYFDKNKVLVAGADHDILYSIDVDEILEAGITKEDAEELASLNWMIHDGSYLACFV